MNDLADEGFHEIQLSGKQLVFLFMATTVLAVLIFLCGVQVGRGVRPERGIEMADDAAAAAPPPPAATPSQPAAAGGPPAPEPRRLRRAGRAELRETPERSVEVAGRS